MTFESPLSAVREALVADRATLRAAVERVPPALRGTKPAPDRWSVANVLEHLSLVEARVLSMLDGMIPSVPLASGPSSAASPGLDRSLLRNRSVRINAPEAIQPTGAMDADAAWSALERTRAQLLALLDTATDRDLTTMIRQHPVLGQLDGYQWIAAIGGHEERHALQIQEIADALPGAAQAG